MTTGEKTATMTAIAGAMARDTRSGSPIASVLGSTSPKTSTSRVMASVA